ncbi:beta-glucuronidase-like [Littorina saxatilis]|uniref:Beta-glucuronidase n=1 Tax=Littorina saxatilis TaxID=31220 RepID=A0AAN9AII1_9CAEN
MEGVWRPLRFLVWSVLPVSALCTGILYPRDSESRVVKDLDGMWNFRADTSSTRNQSFVDQWWMKPLSATGDVIPMPVPSSYNDITNDKSLRDFVGWVWYDRDLYVSKAWQSERVLLRFGSAHYYAMVWVNGQQVMTHDGGHLPFEGQINSALSFSGVNRITVAVNNTLLPTTLPPGSLTFKTDTRKYPLGYFVQNVQMDFFNYAGIHRHVHLYTTPNTFIDDITVVTSIRGKDGVVTYSVMEEKASGDAPTNVEVTIEDRDGNTVSAQPSNRLQDTIVIPNARLWWPWTMKPDDAGYLYTLKVNVSGDIYRQPFGIRTVKVTDTQFLINGLPFYCHGVAKHEDSDIRGKGLDYPLIARDFAMLKWLGANCFRTSHYPYAEEIMDQADQQGIVVIDESPGVGIVRPENFGPVSLAHHKAVMAEMVQRDKNRPSVCMWSVANEPASQLPQAENYFKEVISYTRTLDKSGRPVTFVANQDYYNDLVTQFVDVICLNRYYGWYSDAGHTEVIHLQLGEDFANWRSKHNKPIMITEYGADTIAGLHQEPSFTFTEEFQTDFMSEYHKTFDKFRSQFLVGEMVWNFADFMTVQGVTRVVGNRKGVLTRQRQPKASGHLLRSRYLSLANSTRPVFPTEPSEPLIS